ncbi:MAG: hypothetical protein ACTSUK_01000 [Promethearchaeota archaeon]
MKCFTTEDAKTLLKYAEKGLKFDELVAKHNEIIVVYDQKVADLEIKISVLEDIKEVLIADNEELAKELRKSKKKWQIFKNTTITLGILVGIETVVLILFLN